MPAGDDGLAGCHYKRTDRSAAARGLVAPQPEESKHEKQLSSPALAALTVFGALCGAGPVAAIPITQLQDKDIAKGKAAVASLEKNAGATAIDVKARIDADIVALQSDVKSAAAKLAEMKQASTGHWKEFDVDVSAATVRLRKSTQCGALQALRAIGEDCAFPGACRGHYLMANLMGLRFVPTKTRPDSDDC